MRTIELQKWLEEHGTAEHIVESIPNMPVALRKELVEEALRYDQIRRQYEDPESIFSGELRDRHAISSYAKYPAILPNPPLELPGLTSQNAPISNIVANSSLFAVRPSVKYEPNRPVMHNYRIATRGGAEIEYSGERLYQSDEDVLLILKEISKEGLGKIYDVPAYQILKRMNQTTGGRSYTELAKALHRLQWTSISIRYNPTSGNNQYCLGSLRKNRRVGFNIVTFFDIDPISKRFRFSLNPALVILYGNNEYGLVDLKNRFQLGKNELAKMLQGIFASQAANCQIHKVAKIKEWSCLASDMKAFTRQLKKALDELIRVGVIKAYWISIPPKGQSEDKRLYIWKNQLPTKLEPIPKGNGHFQSTETYCLSMAKTDAAIEEF